MIRHIVLFTAKNKTDIDRNLSTYSRFFPPSRMHAGIACNRKTDQLGNDVDVVVKMML
ncbi:hypothetical protein [Bradyrhizobium sp. CCBAU 53415]|uniref:hypothetical protein n=1 Tax=Bradyrhizobium sp. CCBAU 53415 TaxID=1325119 RepID=UPI002304F3FC|nr:hypothetical protein [Bradyrhizobium sp. CCBAU 53415]